MCPRTYTEAPSCSNRSASSASIRCGSMCSRSAASMTVSPARSRPFLRRAPRRRLSDEAATAASPRIRAEAGERLRLRGIRKIDAQALLIALLADRVVQRPADAHAEQEQIGGRRIRLDIPIDAPAGVAQLAVLHLEVGELEDRLSEARAQRESAFERPPGLVVPVLAAQADRGVRISRLGRRIE